MEHHPEQGRARKARRRPPGLLDDLLQERDPADHDRRQDDDDEPEDSDEGVLPFDEPQPERTECRPVCDEDDREAEDEELRRSPCGAARSWSRRPSPRGSRGTPARAAARTVKGRTPSRQGGRVERPGSASPSTPRRRRSRRCHPSLLPLSRSQVLEVAVVGVEIRISVGIGAAIRLDRATGVIAIPPMQQVEQDDNRRRFAV